MTAPDAAQIKVDVTDKAGLLSVFGEPYQVGLDSGDQTWRWLYARTSTSGTMTNRTRSRRMFPKT